MQKYKNRVKNKHYNQIKSAIADSFAAAAFAGLADNFERAGW